jgi:N-formylglutamate amidohydrolase
MDVSSELRPGATTQSAPAAPARDGEPPFTVIEPLHRLGPVIFASPHSGRVYPGAVMQRTKLALNSLRRAEDAYVDELFAPAASFGAPVLCANLARAYVDVNRDPAELDANMFEDGRSLVVQAGSPRVQAGLGVIPRLSGDGHAIYRGKLPAGEAERRLARMHTPYHDMLAGMMHETRAAFGCAVLIDCHSMPSSVRGAGAPDIVLGDRFGASCHPAVTAHAESLLRRMGYRVARNTPFAGGHTTQRYGRPAERWHTLQIELSRGLYLEERTLQRSGAFARVRADMARLTAGLIAADFVRMLA